MSKLTAEWCMNHIESMKTNGLSLLEEKYLQALEIALPVLEQQGGWISCSERMPELNVEVMVWIEESEDYLGVATIAKGWENCWWLEVDKKCVTIESIAYWQPLPAPPHPQSSTAPQIDNDEDRGDDEAFWDADYD